MNNADWKQLPFRDRPCYYNGMNKEKDCSASQDRSFVMERKGRIQDLDRSFDLEYWQRLGPEAIFSAAWQMVLDILKDRDIHAPEPRLQRSVEAFGKLPG